MRYHGVAPVKPGHHERCGGYRINLTIDEFKRVLREVGTSIIGQTTTLLADGSVLVVGGCGNFPSWTPLASAEIYRPPHASTP